LDGLERREPIIDKWELIDFECITRAEGMMDDYEIYTLKKGDIIKRVDDYTFNKMKKLGLIMVG